MAEYDLVYDGREYFPDGRSQGDWPAKTKVEVVKAIRLLTGLGLKEAKERSEDLLANPHQPIRVDCDEYNHNLQRSQTTFNQVIGELRKVGVQVCRVTATDACRKEHRLKIDDQIEDLAIQAIRERAYDRARQLMQILENA